MNRTLLHVDMDAFFAAVEQHDRPGLRGRPVVVGSLPDRRGVVAAASYEARAFGIRSAMPSREAGRRCPHAVFLPVRMVRYREVSAQVFGLFERYTPLVEPLSIDEGFLDVTGARPLFGAGPEIARSLRAAIREETGLTASVGVAPNKFLAKLASELDKPDGLTVVPEDPGDLLAFLAPLPVRRLWGAGAVLCARLERAGLLTLGDLQACDPDRLAGLVGLRPARGLQRLARGLDRRPVQPSRAEKSLSRELTFDTDCRDAQRVEHELLRLAEDVGRRLRRADRYAGTAHLKLRWENFETITRQRRLDPPCCDDFRLRRAARDLFRAHALPRPVRLVGFGVSALRDAPAEQLDLFSDRARDTTRRERLSRLVDELRRRYGPGSIGPGSGGPGA